MMSQSGDYQQQFVEFALQVHALRFGEYTLKSGRKSPYFFNVGDFKTGRALAQLGKYYARAIVASGVEFDLLFGPAYKGIPLVAAVSIALAEEHGIDKPFCFDRKEAKDHGEGGVIVGAEMAGRVLMIDDVITAGTTFRQVVQMIEKHGAQFAGVITALDRQEVANGERSASQELSAQYQVPFYSIVKLTDIIHYLDAQGNMDSELARLRNYQAEYGCQ
jgi:orotate phosphoribosyltransferase